MKKLIAIIGMLLFAAASVVVFSATHIKRSQMTAMPIQGRM